MENQHDEARQLLKLAERELVEAMNLIRAARGYAPLSELAEPPYCSSNGRPSRPSSA